MGTALLPGGLTSTCGLLSAWNDVFVTAPAYAYRTEWSPEDGEYVGLVAEFPSLSWLAPVRSDAQRGIRELVDEVVADMRASGEPLPAPLGP
jgi:predicted RNase H-like HicB family nuclease